MESAIEHDRYEFTNPATKHTLADLINLYIERVLPGKPRNAKNVLLRLIQETPLKDIRSSTLLLVCEKNFECVVLFLSPIEVCFLQPT